MELEPNQVLINRYRVIRLLGQGGMGAVYYSHDPILNRYVAIKQLQPDPITGELAADQVRKQFLREAQSLAALHHPNLPRVTDYFIHDDLHYLVMDYIEGQSLLEIVQANQGGLPEDQVLDWADQILGALEYIHQHNLIHRDIKPANIRRTPDGRVFLVDFGLVKPYDASDPKTMTMFHGVGTLEYSPPEQYDAQAHTDQRSDIYSLGATLYHLLSGQLPASLTRRISDPASLQPVHLANTTVSPEVEQVIARAMELERARRFATATEMRAALRAAHRGLLVVEDGATTRLPLAPAPPTTPQRRSRRVLALAAIPAALLLVALAGVATQAGGNGNPVVVPSSTPTATPTVAGAAVPPSILDSASTVTPSLTPTELITTTGSVTSTRQITASPTAQPTVQPTGGSGGSGGSSGSGGGGSAVQPTPKPKNTPPGQVNNPTPSGSGGGNTGGSGGSSGGGNSGSHGGGNGGGNGGKAPKTK